jgi:hypothetical protein
MTELPEALISLNSYEARTAAASLSACSRPMRIAPAQLRSAS